MVQFGMLNGSIDASQVLVTMAMSMLLFSRNACSSCFLLFMLVAFHNMIFIGFLIASFKFFYYLYARFDTNLVSRLSVQLA